MIATFHPCGNTSYGVRFDKNQKQLTPKMKVNLHIRYASGEYVHVPNLVVNVCYELVDTEIRKWFEHLGHINHKCGIPPNYNLTRVGTTDIWILEEI
ncbi:hypothetical protein [Desulfatirhabdium butyrativorans]|uniref:hypothetical protein n=1 Tax=Desulfatirhabdium butyrativorans TaxID=340467 RepID=UPI0012EBF55F|nr:hypothetical protein [Desulfatirhabdium butyrativorans]